MNWKTNLQILDLDANDQIELTCRKCGTLRWLTGEELQSRKGKERLTLGEVEARAKCRQRGCGAAMRLAMPAPQDTAGFVGGIA